MAKQERKLEVLVERNDHNQRILDNLTLEDCDILYRYGGAELVCNDGHVQTIYD